MQVPRSLIVGGFLVAGGLLGWAMNEYGEEATVLLRPTSDSAKLSTSQPAEALNVQPIVVVVTDESAAPPLPESPEQAAGRAGRAGPVGWSADALAPRPTGGHGPAEVAEERALVSPDRSQIVAGGQGFSLTAAGDHIIIANDRSVVQVGDGGRLSANVGDVSSSGAVAIDVPQSTLTTGAAAVSRTATVSSAEDAPLSTLAGGDTELLVGPTPASTMSGGAAGSTALGIPHAAGPRGAGQATALSGWEDHSLLLAGRDHVVTYDDSNVFIERDGRLNMNSGDTDSSGLNVVDATRSTVQTGNGVELESGGADENGGEEEEESGGSATDSSSRATALPPLAAASNAVVTNDVDAAATGRDALAVGGDGLDDLAVDVFGERNVATYDDSNVVIGGSGGANAQIGDSDTSGAVVMGVIDSHIASGDGFHSS